MYSCIDDIVSNSETEVSKLVSRINECFNLSKGNDTEPLIQLDLLTHHAAAQVDNALLCPLLVPGALANSTAAASLRDPIENAIKLAVPVYADSGFIS